MKETIKNNLYTASMVALMAVSLAASLNGFACIIHAAEALEETAVPSKCVGVGREIVGVVKNEPEGEPEYTEKTVIATAYCPCWGCCGKTDGITATGTKATAGRTIAADPDVIPYGTEVIIDGHTYIVEDCGGAIKEDRIDIYFDTHTEALEFGIQELTVKIKKEPLSVE